MGSPWARTDITLFVDTTGLGGAGFMEFIEALSRGAPDNLRPSPRSSRAKYFGSEYLCFGWRGEPLHVWSWGGYDYASRLYKPEEILRLMSFNQN